ncbi:putative transcription factor C2H2 family [Lupinus albus]|uniref:Putative transcription factor C2H2 family n=1 Tax=Lupinus albus TaxID=3870 RepID=A0A6A4PN58_LUPAL|nr:putative transcription factor C2H2 family [Lupinus albus]
MDNQLYQRRTHTPEHESHGVHVCNKCGWSYPKPHPSAKHRRAHKKICGTIEGYKLCASEGQAHLNGCDGEHVSDDDHKTPGLVVSGPKNLDRGKSEKGNDGIRERLVRLRSEDEVFSDAVADFSDIGLSPGTKEPLKQDCLDSDVGRIIVKSSDDCQIHNHSILQFESVEVENTLDLQGHLSDSIVDPLPSSIADFGTEESTFVHSNDFFDLSSDSNPCKAEALPDVFLENKINADENVTDCNLISLAKETNLLAKDEIKSDVDVVENVNSSDSIVDETYGVSDIAVSGVISSDHQVGDEAVLPMEKNSTELLSVQANDDFPLVLNSVEIMSALTNDIQVESAHLEHFSTSSDANILQEKGEGNANADTPLTRDSSPEVAHPQSEYEGFEDPEGVVSQDPLSLPSESINFEHTAEETNAEEKIEVSPVKLTVESFDRSDEIGGSMNAIETEINESHIIPFSEEQGTIDGCKVSQQISLPEGSLVASSNENPRDASFDSATSEKTGVISIDNVSHHEKKSTAINSVAVGGNNVRADVESDTGTKMKDLQPHDFLQSEVTQSSDIIKSDDAREMGKVENCDITESLVISEAVVDATTRNAKGIQCSNIGPISVPQVDIKEDEFNSNDDYNRSADAQDSEVIVKAAENLARMYASLSLSTGPSAQHDSAVEDNQDGEHGGKMSGIPAASFQDRSVNSSVKHSSSGFDASVDTSSRCDSLEGNWGSVSEWLSRCNSMLQLLSILKLYHQKCLNHHLKLLLLQSRKDPTHNS